MAVTYGFYNSLNGDRKYDADDFGSMFDGVIKDGVYQSVGNHLNVVAGTGMQVIVETGKAWFNKTWTINDARLPLTIQAADTVNPRNDAVILEVDTRNQTRANSIKVIKGTPSANPVNPTLTKASGLYQYALAYVRVNKSATSIVSGNITVNVGKGDCPFVTGILQTTSVDSLFTKWEGDFTTWFNNVKAQLAGNVAENLQKQIDTINTTVNGLKTSKADLSRVTALETWKNTASATLASGSTFIVYGTKSWSARNTPISITFNKDLLGLFIDIREKENVPDDSFRYSEFGILAVHSGSLKVIHKGFRNAASGSPINNLTMSNSKTINYTSHYDSYQGSLEYMAILKIA